MNPADETARNDLERLLHGFQVSRMLRTAADLALADRIVPGATRRVADLADECGVQPMPLLRILRALAAVGVFRVSPADDIAHTAMSQLLRTDTPNSLHYGARFWAGAGSWRAWGELDAALAGGIPHEAAWGEGRFAYLRRHPDEARVFDDYMAHFPDNRHAAVAGAYDFSAAKRIVDVGGGNGEALRHILARYPRARGLVFDRDDVIARIGADARMQGRIDVEGGSFFDAVPTGGDVYMLMRVLHDYGDDDCLRILRNCRAAVHDSARLLVCEQLLEAQPDAGDATLYLLDVQMMAMFGSARERSEAEFSALFASAGFSPPRRIPTSSRVSILEVAPVRV